MCFIGKSNLKFHGYKFFNMNAFDNGERYKI